MLQEVIETKLHKAFNPIYLWVENESYLHNVPAGSQSHFKVIIVSDVFEGLRPLQRHRKVNLVLSEEMAEPIHALSIYPLTESEWQLERGVIRKTPPCLGGDSSCV